MSFSAKNVLLTEYDRQYLNNVNSKFNIVYGKFTRKTQLVQKLHENIALDCAVYLYLIDLLRKSCPSR